MGLREASLLAQSGGSHVIAPVLAANELCPLICAVFLFGGALSVLTDNFCLVGVGAGKHSLRAKKGSDTDTEKTLDVTRDRRDRQCSFLPAR